ncbi:MAG: hypothetical protein ACRC37_06605, partial [Lentisphaeria bacterium]
MENFCRDIGCVTFDVGFTILFPRIPLVELYDELLLLDGIIIPNLEDAVSKAWNFICQEKKDLIYGSTYCESLENWRVFLKIITCSVEIEQNKLNLLSKKFMSAFSAKHNWVINPNWSAIHSYCRKQNWTIGLISNWDLNLGVLLKELNII